MPNDLEGFWAAVLSEEPLSITRALDSISEDERPSVIEHLQRMATEPGWSEGQRRCAKAALVAIEKGEKWKIPFLVRVPRK